MSRASGFISTDQTLKKEQMDQLRRAWGEVSQGLNSGEVPILHSGLKFQSLSLSSQDAQLVEAYHMSVEEIARAFRIPLPMIGDLRNSTYNNVEQLVSMWLATGLGFLLEHVEQALGLFFRIGNNECIQFDTKGLLRSDFKGRIDALVRGISGGLYSVNEARSEEGLPAVDYGEEPRLQAQVIPLSAIDIPPSGPVPNASDSDDSAEDDPDDEERQLLAYARLRQITQKYRVEKGFKNAG
jgi:HK97 family phage portal protein